MCMCMCVCVHIYMCTCNIYMYVCVYVHACVCMHVCVCVVYVCVYLSVCVCFQSPEYKMSRASALDQKERERIIHNLSFDARQLIGEGNVPSTSYIQTWKHGCRPRIHTNMHANMHGTYHFCVPNKLVILCTRSALGKIAHCVP